VGGVCLFPQAPLVFPFKKTTIIRKATSGVCLIPSGAAGFPKKLHSQQQQKSSRHPAAQCFRFPGIGPEAESNPVTLRIKYGIIPKKVVFVPIRLRNQIWDKYHFFWHATVAASRVAPRAANSSCPLVVLTEWREQSSKGRYEAVMWRAAGLEEPNAKGAKGAEGGADADAEMEVDNLTAGGFFGWMGREQHGPGG
jgi:hypothetical protein